MPNMCVLNKEKRRNVVQMLTICESNRSALMNIIDFILLFSSLFAELKIPIGAFIVFCYKEDL